jgi:type I restriction enzyme S subunit
VSVSNVDKHTVDGETPVRMCNYVDVYKNDVVTSDLTFMNATATPEQVRRFSLRRGDVVFTKDSETADDIGVPALVDADGLVCGYHLAIARPDPSVVYPKFLFYAMKSSVTADQWRLIAAGVTRVGLRSADIPKVLLPLPSSDRQRAISNFLDRETARIDDLIAEQQTLAATLETRRSAMISHHVAWPVEQPVSRNFTVVLGKMLDAGRTSRDDDVTLPYLRALNIQDRGLVLDSVNEMAFTAIERLQLDLRAGDLLVVEGGAGVANAQVLESDMPGWSFQKTLNRVRARSDGGSTRFLAYVIRALRDSGFIDVVCNKSTIPHLTAEKLLALRVPQPPLDEQLRIVDLLDRETARIDMLVAECEALTALLQERRAALITAAVTGQLDVRAS